MAKSENKTAMQSERTQMGRSSSIDDDGATCRVVVEEADESTFLPHFYILIDIKITYRRYQSLKVVMMVFVMNEKAHIMERKSWASPTRCDRNLVIISKTLPTDECGSQRER